MTDAVSHPDVAELRRNYTRDGLRRNDLDPDPIGQFRKWFTEAVAAELIEPNAMVLGTTDGKRPSARSVLLKACDERGFVFFTNYESRKARELGSNAKVSLHFPWHSIERQVEVSGVAEKISAAESRDYFHARPRESQLAAWASAQSRPSW